MYSKASVAALLAGVAAAVHAPVGNPEGNPIFRPLLEVVPACEPFTITWNATTPNTVSLLLLRGPSTNAVPLGAPIVEGIANTGTFVWTPSADLEADVTRYGIQLIDDVTGQYQYSTQFGISTDQCAADEPTYSTTTESGYGGGYPTTSETPAPETSTIGYPVDNSTSTYTPYPTSTGTPSGTGYPIHNTTVIQPTKPLTVPSSLKTTASATAPPSSTVSSPPENTGAASALRAGLGLVGAVAGFAFML